MSVSVSVAIRCRVHRLPARHGRPEPEVPVGRPPAWEQTADRPGVARSQPGNPIPGSDYVEPDASSLTAHPVGESFTVRRIPEELEFTPGRLEFPEEPSLTGLQRDRDGVVARRHAHGRDRRAPRGGRRLRERADPGHVVPRGAAALAAATVLMLGACGTTYVDTSVTTVAHSTTG